MELLELLQHGKAAHNKGMMEGDIICHAVSVEDCNVDEDKMTGQLLNLILANLKLVGECWTKSKWRFVPCLAQFIHRAVWNLAQSEKCKHFKEVRECLGMEASFKTFSNGRLAMGRAKQFEVQNLLQLCLLSTDAAESIVDEIHKNLSKFEESLCDEERVPDPKAVKKVHKDLETALRCFPHLCSKMPQTQLRVRFHHVCCLISNCLLSLAVLGKLNWFARS